MTTDPAAALNLCWFHPDDEGTPFPDVGRALRDPDGLLAVGGKLSAKRLIEAYRHGIFPWYSADQPVLWWSPDPRLVLFPGHLRVSRSLRKTVRRELYSVTFDTAFRRVIKACAAPRRDGMGTWLTPDMMEAYCHLHELGYAHSVEAWCEGELAGGLYGVALGRVFFGESMFARRTDASKVAFVHAVEQLRDWGYALIDCQVRTAHLQSLGAQELPRWRFTRMVEQWRDVPGKQAPWRMEVDVPQLYAISQDHGGAT